jgi:hypothetical protein
MDTVTVHVRIRADGTWVAEPSDLDEPIAECGEAFEAMRAAAEHVQAQEGGEVIVHDRYGHLHVTRHGRRITGSDSR